MTEYNRIQVEYREQSKTKIKRQLEIAGKQATDEELEQMLEVSKKFECCLSHDENKYDHYGRGVVELDSLDIFR